MNARLGQGLAIALIVAGGAILGLRILEFEAPVTRDEAHETAPAHGAEDHDAHGAEGPAEVHFSADRLAEYDVEVLSAGPARIRETLALIGEIRFNEDHLVHVVPRLAGVAQTVTANAGDRVAKDQLLATLSSQTLSDQRSELRAARKRLKLARASFAREEKLWREGISAEQDYLEAQTALREAEIAADNAAQKLASLGGAEWEGSDLTRYELRAPIAGVVIDKHIARGEAVKDDASVFVIADMSTVWAELTVYAKDLNAVHIGQTATVRATAFDAASSGTISYVGPLVGEQTRAATARLTLPNPDGVWRPGLPVNVELTASETEVPVAVSRAALQTLDDATVVFVYDGEHFVPRTVQTGRSDGGRVEIVSGLAAGERYAARNSFLVKAELGKAGASHEH